LDTWVFEDFQGALSLIPYRQTDDFSAETDSLEELIQILWAWINNSKEG
jgi:hypothetical protein